MASPTLDLLLQQAIDLHRAGKLEEAVQAYKKVLHREGRAAGALNLLGLAEFQLGHLPAAADALMRAARLNPELPNLDYNLARVLQAQGRLEESLLHYQKAIAKAPNDAEALSNLGTVLVALKRQDEAIAHYRRATSLNPNFADAWHNLGNVLKLTQRLEEALDAYGQALVLRPHYAATMESIAYVLNHLDRPIEAADYALRAVSAEPNVVEHHVSLANALAVIGRDDEARTAYDAGLALDPGSAEALMNKGLFLLSRGRFAEGWPLYEQRWQVSQTKLKRRPYSAPRWTGQPVAGPLLVWAEQGLGDQVLYSSMMPDLQTLADKIVLEVDPRLVPLLARSFPNVRVVPQHEVPYAEDFTAQVALGDIGRYLRPDAASFRSSAGGYLKTDHARTQALRTRLGSGRQRVIGLSWSSSNQEFGRFKSARLAELAPVLQIPDCRFVDLQYGDTSKERADIEAQTGIHIDRLAEIDNTNDIDGLAALMAACDAVVSVSNTNAHLAAAQGKATFVLLSDAGGLFWYWMKRGDSTPLYAQARLFRKRGDQSWPQIAASDVAPALAEYLRNPAR